MDPQDLGVVLVGRAPDVGQKRAVRHQPAAVSHQAAQELELGWREMHVLAVDRDAVRSLIQLEAVRA